MHFTQVAYGGCWKDPHAWQRCSASTPCLAESQKGLVSSFGTGMGLVTALQSLIGMVWSLPIRLHRSTREPGCWPAEAMSRARRVTMLRVPSTLARWRMTLGRVAGRTFVVSVFAVSW